MTYWKKHFWSWWNEGDWKEILVDGSFHWKKLVRLEGEKEEEKGGEEGPKNHEDAVPRTKLISA